MITRYTLFSLILIWNISITYSQNNYVRLDQIQGVPMTITYNLNEEKNVEGSRYYDDEWKEIKLETIDGLNILIPQGKLDIYLDELIVNNKGGAFILDKKSEIISFTIESKRFITSSYGNGLLGYFEEIYNGANVILLKKQSCIIQRGKPSNGIIKGTPDKYVKTDDYYVKKEEKNNEALKLKVRPRKIQLKNSKFQELSVFLENYKGGYKSDQQLIEVFKEFDKSN